ncbi:MAG: hypothetical protein H6553_00795 [Chitinophagales bacterium]|nr:hypothetical protein [Chitinophagales bacterium]
MIDKEVDRQARRFIYKTWDFFQYRSSHKCIIEYVDYSQIVTNIHQEIWNNASFDDVKKRIQKCLHASTIYEDFKHRIDQWYENLERVTGNSQHPFSGQYVISHVIDDIKTVQKYLFPEEKILAQIIEYGEEKLTQIEEMHKVARKNKQWSSVHQNHLFEVMYTNKGNINPSTAQLSDYQYTFNHKDEIFAVFFTDRPLTTSLIEQSKAKTELFEHRHWNCDPYTTKIAENMLSIIHEQYFIIIPIVVHFERLLTYSEEQQASVLQHMNYIEKWQREKHYITLFFGNMELLSNQSFKQQQPFILHRPPRLKNRIKETIQKWKNYQQ